MKTLDRLARTVSLAGQRELAHVARYQEGGPAYNGVGVHPGSMRASTRSALEARGLITVTDNRCQLTALGRELVDHLGRTPQW